MSHPAPIRTGRAPYGAYETWYMIFGDLEPTSGKLPLITVHGGPGAGCGTLEVLGKLWVTAGVPVVVYDQVGCGRSTHVPDAPSETWTVDFFLEELKNLLAHLNVQSYDLLGHSWGGMLGLEHAARQPTGLRRLIIEGSPASMELCMQVRDDVYRSLGEKYYQAVLRHDNDQLKTYYAADAHQATEEADRKDLDEARALFTARYMSRTKPLPQVVVDVLNTLVAAYNVCDSLWGLTKILESTGSLKNWSIIPRLHLIRNKVLVITGDWDYCGGKTLEPYFKGGLADVRMITFGDCGHIAHIDAGDEYVAAVHNFLKE